MHMAKTSFSFCPLLLCSSSSRHTKFQYCGWKKSCTTFKGLHLKPRAPNSILLQDSDQNGFVRVTEILHHLSTPVNMSFGIALGGMGVHGASYALANVWCRGGAGFLPPTVGPCMVGLSVFFFCFNKTNIMLSCCCRIS